MGRNTPAETWDYELKLREKEYKLKFRQYMEIRFIDCLVSRFGVPKGDFDIRLVWDAKKNGYNLTLWAPSFWFPTFATLTDLIVKWLPCTLVDYRNGKTPVTTESEKWQRCHQSDMDIGEMYLNFMLHYSECHSFGVRMERKVDNDLRLRVTFMRFQRLMFGCKLAPYLVVQGHVRGLEVFGDRHDPQNPFQWKSIITNFLFSKGYNPSLTCIIKIRSDGDLALGAPTFMDDERSTGSTKVNAQATAQIKCWNKLFGQTGCLLQEETCVTKTWCMDWETTAY